MALHSFRQATTVLNLAEEAYCFAISINGMSKKDALAYLARDDLPVKHEDIIAYSICLWAPKCGLRDISIWRTVRFHYLSDLVAAMLYIMIRSDDLEERLSMAEEYNTSLPDLLNLLIPVGNIQLDKQSAQMIGRALDDRAHSIKLAKNEDRIYPFSHYHILEDLNASRIPRHSYHFTLSSSLDNFSDKGCGIFFIWLDPKDPLASNAIIGSRKAEADAASLPLVSIHENLEVNVKKNGSIANNYSKADNYKSDVSFDSNNFQATTQSAEKEHHYLPEKYVQNVQKWGEMYSIGPHIFSGRQCFMAVQQSNIWLKWNQSVQLCPNRKVLSEGKPFPDTHAAPFYSGETVYRGKDSIESRQSRRVDSLAVSNDGAFEESFGSIKQEMRCIDATGNELADHLEIVLRGQLRPHTIQQRRMSCLRWTQHISSHIMLSKSGRSNGSPNHNGNDHFSKMSHENVNKDYLVQTYLALAKEGRWIELCDIARLCILWLFGPGSLYIDLDFSPGTARFPTSYISRAYSGEKYDWMVDSRSIGEIGKEGNPAVSKDHERILAPGTLSGKKRTAFAGGTKLILGKDNEGLLQNNFLFLPLTSNRVESFPPHAIGTIESPICSEVEDVEDPILKHKSYSSTLNGVSNSTQPGKMFLEVALHAIATSACSEFNPLYATGPVFLTSMYYALKQYSLSRSPQLKNRPMFLKQNATAFDTLDERKKPPKFVAEASTNHIDSLDARFLVDGSFGEAESDDEESVASHNEILPPKLEHMPLDPLFIKEYKAFHALYSGLFLYGSQNYAGQWSPMSALSPGRFRHEDTTAHQEPTTGESSEDTDFIHVLPTACLFPYHWTEKPLAQKGMNASRDIESPIMPSNLSKPDIAQLSSTAQSKETGWSAATSKVLESNSPAHNERPVGQVVSMAKERISVPDSSTELSNSANVAPNTNLQLPAKESTQNSQQERGEVSPKNTSASGSSHTPMMNIDSSHQASTSPEKDKSLFGGIELAALLEGIRRIRQTHATKQRMGPKKRQRLKMKQKKKQKKVMKMEERTSLTSEGEYVSNPEVTRCSSQTSDGQTEAMTKEASKAVDSSVPHYGTHGWDTTWAPSQGYEAYLSIHDDPVREPSRSFYPPPPVVHFDTESYNARTLRQNVSQTLERVKTWVRQVAKLALTEQKETPDESEYSDEEMSTASSEFLQPAETYAKRLEVEIYLSKVEEFLMSNLENVVNMDWDIKEICQAIEQILVGSHNLGQGVDSRNVLMDLSTLLTALLTTLRTESKREPILVENRLDDIRDKVTVYQQLSHVLVPKKKLTEGKVFLCCRCRSQNTAEPNRNADQDGGISIPDLSIQIDVLRSLRSELVSGNVVAKKFLLKFAPFSVENSNAMKNTLQSDHSSQIQIADSQADSSALRGNCNCICCNVNKDLSATNSSKSSGLEKPKWLKDAMKCAICKQACLYLTLSLHVLLLLFYSYCKESDPFSYSAKLKSLELAIVQGKTGEYTTLVCDELVPIINEVWKCRIFTPAPTDKPSQMFNFFGKNVPSYHPYLREYFKQETPRGEENKHDISYVMPESTYQDKYGCLSLAFRIAKRMQNQGHIIPNNTLLKYWSKN